MSDAPASAGWYERLGFVERWRHQFEPGPPVVCARPNTIAAEFGVAVDEDGLVGREITLTDLDGNRFRIATPRT